MCRVYSTEIHHLLSLGNLHPSTVTQYLEHIHTAITTFETVYASDQYAIITPLFKCILHVPASSTSFERVFSKSGVIIKPNCAKMTERGLEELVLLKSNC